MSLVLLLMVGCVVSPCAPADWLHALVVPAESGQRADAAQATSGDLVADDGPPAQPARLMDGETAGSTFFEQETPSLVSPADESLYLTPRLGQCLARATVGSDSGQFLSLVTGHVRLQI